MFTNISPSLTGMPFNNLSTNYGMGANYISPVKLYNTHYITEY